MYGPALVLLRIGTHSKTEMDHCAEDGAVVFYSDFCHSLTARRSSFCFRPRMRAELQNDIRDQLAAVNSAFWEGDTSLPSCNENLRIVSLTIIRK